MNTFRVKVGRTTRKGMECLYDTVVNSDCNEHDLYKAYANRYAGLLVEVHPVQTVEAFTPIGGTQPSVREKVSSVDYSEATEYSEGQYRARIYKRDIPEWGELTKPISDAQEAAKEAKTAFCKFIAEKYGLKDVQNFMVTYDEITFSFYKIKFRVRASHVIAILPSCQSTEKLSWQKITTYRGHSYSILAMLRGDSTVTQRRMANTFALGRRTFARNGTVTSIRQLRGCRKCLVSIESSSSRNGIR